MMTSKSSNSLSSWLESQPFTKNIFNRAHVYDTVFDSDAESGPSKPVKRQLVKVSLLISITIVLVIELIFIILTPNSAPLISSVNIQELSEPYMFANSSGYAGCGDSSETALSRGCKFDYLTISWETPECYNTKIVDNFFSAHDWKYYNDSRGTPVPAGVSITDGHQRWNVKWGFHVTHCVYTWKIMQKAVFERRPLADNLLDLEHTKHCMAMMLDKTFSWEDMHTMVHVKWPKCASFEDWDKAKWVENLVLPS